VGALDDKVAVITGSGRGIGRGMALLFAAEGAKVIVVDPGVNTDGTGTDSGPADQVVEEIRAAGGEAAPCYESVVTVEGGEKIVQTALDAFGRLDILVNNAGILRDRMIFNMTEDEWDAVIAVHLKGHFCCTKPASIIFRQQRYGRIINFSSVSGLIGIAGQANYGAAKSGVAGFTRVVARDLGRYGVTCNAISPGAATRMTATIPDTARRQQPSSDERAPERVAPMAAYLASDDAWNINGYIFGVAGGNVSVLQHPSAMRTIWKQGLWTLDELQEQVPGALMSGVANPAPPPPEFEVPGRPAPATSAGAPA
jgi:NAD(P)-dependent dehydrogenase (short-subunit alcohol dehydrogenase family)